MLEIIPYAVCKFCRLMDSCPLLVTLRETWYTPYISTGETRTILSSVPPTHARRHGSCRRGVWHRPRCLDASRCRLGCAPHAHCLGLAPKLCRRGLAVSVRVLLQAWGTRSPVSWGQQEATAEEIEACTAKHLALHHFQTVDVSLDRTGAPRQGDAGFDRLVVLYSPFAKR